MQHVFSSTCSFRKRRVVQPLLLGWCSCSTWYTNLNFREPAGDLRAMGGNQMAGGYDLPRNDTLATCCIWCTCFFNLILWCKIILNWHPPAGVKQCNSICRFSVSPIESPIHCNFKKIQIKVIFNWWMLTAKWWSFFGGEQVPTSSPRQGTTRWYTCTWTSITSNFNVFQHLFEISRHLGWVYLGIAPACASPNKHLFCWR